MDAETERTRREWAEQIPQSYRANYDKAWSSKAAAIKAKCLDCMCWQRVEVADCTIVTCPLWPHRPYQPRGAEKSPRIEDFSEEREKSVVRGQ